MTLQELADLDQTDARTDKGNHGYFDIYEELFAPFRDTDLPILEIGVGMGGSLKVWQEWFTRAYIHGVDARPCEQMGGRILIHQGFTLDADFLAAVARQGPFAIIIDDGSHCGDDQQSAFRGLWPAVAPGGLYVIEDLHAAYMEYYAPSGMPFLRLLVDSLNVKGEFDDIRRITFYPKLFVAEKR